MSLTPRFQFSYFGGGTPGSITDEGMKFTGLDRLVLDRLLSSIETNDGHLRPFTLVAPPAADVDLLIDEGSLMGGTEYFYRYGIVDADGNESIVSEEVSLQTPALLVAPGQPSVVDEGQTGTLRPGMYYYALTALRGAEESTLSGATMATMITGGSGALTVMLPDLGPADSFRVWRMGSTEAGYTQIGITDPAAETFLDDGATPSDPCACDPGNLPPQTNNRSAIYGALVTVPLELLQNARSWRLYRTTTSGVYTGTSLVHDVVERMDEWDMSAPLQASWVDRGARTTAGRPSFVDMNMRFQPYVFDSAEQLPDPAPYPENYPLMVGEVLHVQQGGQWVTVGGGGGGGGGMSSIMTSPNGNRFILGVDDNGALTTTPTFFPGPPAPVQNVTVL